MSANGTSNGHSRVLKHGVWAPIPTFYDDNEELDLETFKSHVLRLANSGMQPVICGSMGEALHLEHQERVTLFKTAREALDEAGLTDVVLIAGTGSGSTRETVALSKSAAQAGADVVIVIPPGYFAGAMSKEAIKTFFLDVATASPIPVMMYNYPGAAGSIDMDSDLIIDVAKSSPNICGVKLTCGAVGKLTRIAAATAVPEFKKKYPRSSPTTPDFLTMGGFADFLLPTVLASRAGGAIMGLGNIFPKSLNKLMEYSLKKDLAGEDLQKALELQDLASSTDQTFARVGIAGAKWFLKEHEGYPNGRVRRPLLDLDEKVGRALEANEDVKRFREIEKSL